MDFFELLMPPGHPGKAGDPGMLGWSIFAAYLVSALICWYNSRFFQKSKASPDRIDRVFWCISALGMLILGLNKQMDLQNWVIWIGEVLSKRVGLYEHRRIIQTVFFLLSAVVGAAFLGWGFRLLKGRRKEHTLLLLGGMGLAGFVVLRVGNFNHVVAPLWKILPFTGHYDPAHLLELISLLLIGAGATRSALKLRKDRNLLSNASEPDPRRESPPP
ncbi:MAG: hypothetical protein KJ645_02020 [Planctomycetes bacterium]|nr:hypothetical protein [Planctomycetota bacterium]